MGSSSSPRPAAPDLHPDLPTNSIGSPSFDIHRSAHTQTTSMPAVVEWVQDDGQLPCYLGHSDTNPVHFIFYFDASTKTTVLQLSIVLALRKRGSKPFGSKEPLYLRLQHNNPSHLRHLSINEGTFCQPPLEFTQQLPGQGLGSIRLSVELTNPPDLIAPDWPLTPQNNNQFEVFDSVRLLARQTVFHIHLQHDASLPMDGLRSLCTSLSKGEVLRSDDALKDPSTLYHGRCPSAKVISAHLLMPNIDLHLGDVKQPCDDRSPTQSPPPYHNLDPPPPPPPHSAPSGGKKRRRASSGFCLGPSSDTGLAAVVSSAVREQTKACMEELCRRIVADEVVPMASRVKQLEERVAEVERERDEAKSRIEELEAEVQGLESYIDDRVWLEVDDLQTGVRDNFEDLERDIRGDLKDLVQEQVGPAMVELKRQLATADVNIIEGRLEINYDHGDI